MVIIQIGNNSFLRELQILTYVFVVVVVVVVHRSSSGMAVVYNAASGQFAKAGS